MSETDGGKEEDPERPIADGTVACCWVLLYPAGKVYDAQPVLQTHAPPPQAEGASAEVGVSGRPPPRVEGPRASILHPHRGWKMQMLKLATTSDPHRGWKVLWNAAHPHRGQKMLCLDPHRWGKAQYGLPPPRVEGLFELAVRTPTAGRRCFAVIRVCFIPPPRVEGTARSTPTAGGRPPGLTVCTPTAGRRRQCRLLSLSDFRSG